MHALLPLPCDLGRYLLKDPSALASSPRYATKEVKDGMAAAKHVYMIVNVKDMHWVLVHVDKIQMVS